MDSGRTSSRSGGSGSTAPEVTLDAIRELMTEQWTGRIRGEVVAAIREEMAPLREEVRELREQVEAQAKRLGEVEKGEAAPE
eukprot:12900875-Prorocentrum_lima.AAC.1